MNRWVAPAIAAFSLASGGVAWALADRVAVGSRVTALEVQRSGIEDRLRRIEDKLDRVLGRP